MELNRRREFMNFKKNLIKKDYDRRVTVKYEKYNMSLVKTSFFDALQLANSPFKKEPRRDSSYQEYPLIPDVTLSLFEKDAAKTSVTYDPHREKIIIEERSERYLPNKGEALTTALEHIMIKHGNYQSFFIVNPKDWNTKRKTTHSMKPH